MTCFQIRDAEIKAKPGVVGCERNRALQFLDAFSAFADQRVRDTKEVVPVRQPGIKAHHLLKPINGSLGPARPGVDLPEQHVRIDCSRCDRHRACQVRFGVAQAVGAYVRRADPKQ